MWARGYFCATVGVVDEKTIMEYIENQKWDDDAVTLPSECVSLNGPVLGDFHSSPL
jgi:hypothetical protein